MVVVSDPNLSWAVTKAALVVVSALASVVCLAWAGGRIAFPSESEEQWVEEKTTDSRPSSRARPRDANWPYGSEIAPRVFRGCNKTPFRPQRAVRTPRRHSLLCIPLPRISSVKPDPAKQFLESWIGLQGVEQRFDPQERRLIFAILVSLL
jgi:hypothetical protein